MVTPIQSLRHYPRALSYAKRAYGLLGGKEPRAIIYLTQAYPNNEAAAKPLETVRRGLALVPGAARRKTVPSSQDSGGPASRHPDFGQDRPSAGELHVMQEKRHPLGGRQSVEHHQQREAD